MMSGPAFRIANDYSAIFPIKYSNYTILYSDNSGGRMVLTIQEICGAIWVKL